MQLQECIYIYIIIVSSHLYIYTSNKSLNKLSLYFFLCETQPKKKLDHQNY